MSASPEPAPSHPPTTASVARPACSKTYRSDDLLDGRDEVQIEHAGERYRLRRTRQDKLILTK